MTSPPNIRVVVGDAAVRLSGHERLGSGPVRLKVKREGGGEARSIAVIELEKGARAPDLGPEATGRLVAGVTAEAGVTNAVTFKARARTYVVVDVSGDGWAYAEFTPGKADSGASFGVNDARVDLRDRAISIKPEARLPRRGVVKVRNTGSRPHHAVAVRLDRSTTVDEAVRALRDGAAPDRVGTLVELTGPLSPGTRVDVETVFRRGRYVLTGGRDLLAAFEVR